MARDQIVVVTGIPRSGTSMMMQALAAGGFPVATDGDRAPDEDNPRGYFELEAVKRLRSGPWPGLAELRGHAVKMAHTLLYCLPPGTPHRVILMRRAWNEVVASQNHMLARHGSAPSDNGAALARAFASELERLTAWLDRRGVPLLCLDYAEIIRRPALHLSAVNRFVGGAMRVGPMVAVIDRTLYRNRSNELPGEMGYVTAARPTSPEQGMPNHDRSPTWSGSGRRQSIAFDPEGHGGALLADRPLDAR